MQLCVLCRTRNELLGCDDLPICLVIIIVAFKILALPVTHHHQFTLEFLLLGRAESVFIVVAILFFSVLFLIVVIVTETGFVLVILALSITELLLRGKMFLPCSQKHVVMLRSHELILRRVALAIELARIELDGRISSRAY